MDKKKLNYFVSYAHKNDKTVADFLDKFQDHASMQKEFRFTKWIDGDIILGEDWNSQIHKAADECDFGLMLLSPAYFNSNYIKDQELPYFINDDGIIKPIIPAGLEKFDLNADLHGLEELQIFRYQKSRGESPKFYNELQTNNRNNFIIELVKRMTQKFKS